VVEPVIDAPAAAVVTQPRRRVFEWTVVVAALVYSLAFVYFEWSGAAAYLLAVLPVILAAMVGRTWLAGAFTAMLPMYFLIGHATAGWQHYTPTLALDNAMPLTPQWIFVYASLYVCAFILPLLVVRGRELFQQALKAYLFVMVISYAGFYLYPTIAPRDEGLAVRGFSTWLLELFYDIDQPYGCFPSLHVAYSFVAAMTCYRVHRGVGIAAAIWSALIAVSTVYTKQHYVIDAVVGGLEAPLAYAIFLRGRPRDGVPADDRRLAPRRALNAAAVYAAMIAGFWVAYQLGAGGANG
jgi:membrane-associated phospholipid phosphatase